MVVRVCELCGEEAAVYCGSDAAFLCWKCDARVHEVNFLVARHVRQPICGGCKEEVVVVNGEFVAGDGCWFPLCNSCSADSLSSSSSCVSSSINSKQRKRTRSKPVLASRKGAGGELVRWCGKIGVADDDVDIVAAMACRIFSAVYGSGSSSRVGFGWTRRVWLAASFWMSLSLASLEKMRRLEEVSGVTEKLILVGQARIVRMLKDRKISRDVNKEEGWAESC